MGGWRAEGDSERAEAPPLAPPRGENDQGGALAWRPPLPQTGDRLLGRSCSLGGDQCLKGSQTPQDRGHENHCNPRERVRTGLCGTFRQSSGAQPVAPAHCLLDSTGWGVEGGPVHPPHRGSPQKPNAINRRQIYRINNNNNNN